MGFFPLNQVYHLITACKRSLGRLCFPQSVHSPQSTVCLSTGGYLPRYPPDRYTYTPLGRYTPGPLHPPGRYTPPGQVHHPSHSACWDMVNKWAVHIPLECILVTARKWSLGQGNIFSSMCQEFCPQGEGWWWWYPSMPCSRGGGIPACLAGFQAHTQGGLQAHTQGETWGVWPGGLQAHTWGCLQAHTWGGLQAHTQGGGLQAHTQGVYPSMHWGRPPPPDGYCCRRYASYWNAFLFRDVFNRYSTFMRWNLYTKCTFWPYLHPVVSHIIT